VPQDLLPRLRQRGQGGDRDLAIEVLDDLLDRREHVVEQPRLVGRRGLLRGAQTVAEAVADGDLEVGPEVVGGAAPGLQLGEHLGERLRHQLVGAVLADQHARQPAGGLDLAEVDLAERVAVPRAGALEEQRVVRVVPAVGRELGHGSASVEQGELVAPPGCTYGSTSRTAKHHAVEKDSRRNSRNRVMFGCRTRLGR
jgi:hypothetical protein